MNVPEPKVGGAWQPFTFRGVAAFAQASFSRVFTLHLVAALLGAITVIWFLRLNWLPTIDDALGRLPESSVVRGGELDWKSETPVRLAESRGLTVVVDATDRGGMGWTSDFLVELGRREWRVAWLGGRGRLPYPKGYVIALNRSEALAFWGAWRPFLLTAMGTAVALALMVSWVLLAFLYTAPFWLTARLLQRELRLLGAWKLVAAALMPGALFACLALAQYGLQIIDLIRLLILLALHGIIPWIYLAFALRHLPGRQLNKPIPAGNPFVDAVATPASPPANPFVPSAKPDAATQPTANPFGGPASGSSSPGGPPGQ